MRSLCTEGKEERGDRRGPRAWLTPLCAVIALSAAGCSGANDEAAPSPTPTAAAPTTPTGATTISPTPPASTPEPDPTSSATTPPAAPTPTASVAVAANEVTTGLDRPWGVAFTPDGRTFVTEQDSGRVLELTDGGELSEVQALEVAPQGEGGLLGLAASPDYADDGLLYAYLSTDSDNRVVRFRPGESPEPVLTGVPHGRIHNGGRIAFGPDGMLYVGTGDAGTGSRAQDPGSLAGKILRINPDGTVPADNRFDSPVYSLGHRNVQGLAWDADRQLYASEFGPDADDEINRITAGGNYGWPEVTGMTDGDDFIDPTYVRQPPGASWSGIALSARPAVPRWAGDLLIASLRGQRLWRLELGDDGAVTDAEELLVDEYGRLRTATFAPDGSLWLMTSNTDIYGDPQPGDDRIVRLAPAG